MEEGGPCPIFAGFTMAFALQLWKKHSKTSVGVAEECQSGVLPYMHLYFCPSYVVENSCHMA